MGEDAGTPGRGAPRRAVVVALWLSLLPITGLLITGCGSADDDQLTAPTAPNQSEVLPTGPPGPTTLPTCAESRHVVAFDVFGTLTLNDFDIDTWVDNPSYEPPARTGGAEVAAAYRDRGYELLYMSAAPATTTVGPFAIGDAITGWLQRNDFPTGEGTRVWNWEYGDNARVAMVDELVRLTNAGVSLDAAYTDDPEMADTLATAGTPPERLFTLSEASGVAGSAAVPGDDLTSHLATVEQLERVCQ